MKKQLFFDDHRLFGRDNVVRKYGVAEVVARYSDPVASTDLSTGYVFRLDDGKYRMLYMGISKSFAGLKLFSAISDDGINFSPEELFDKEKNPKKVSKNHIMDLPGEIAYIYEDKYCQKPDERYKLLMAHLFYDELRINDDLYISGDLINWTKKEGVSWADGAEPITSVFYNKERHVHTIVERPFWGVRRAGYKETADWQTFTEYRECLNVDSCDEKLAEIYGMFAFEYEGMYIGLPHMYRHLNSELNAKYKNGIMDTQLAYSYDGRTWQRSLREPFISGIDSKVKMDRIYNMIWMCNERIADDGSVILYGSATEHEHGFAFSDAGTGVILVYKLRQDGFIFLATEDSNAESSIATREKIWNGGELHFNLRAKKATVAVYASDVSEIVSGNALGFSRLLEGYSHEDCIAFSGDSTDWVPEFKNGKTLDELKGRTLVFELKFSDGEVFSLSGDYIDVYNTQAAIYRKYERLPESELS